MGEIKLSITASEMTYSDLTEDLGEILSADTMGRVANTVYGDMKDALTRHIQDDVYGAYTPKEYKRRSEHIGLGRPLSDVDGNSIPILKPGKGGAEVGIIYIPTGEHETRRWHTADGDELIGRLEKKTPPYTWEPKEGQPIPERPFWQKFVDEMVESGFARSASKAFHAAGIEVSDLFVEREAEDGNY